MKRALKALLQEVEQRGRDAANSSNDELIRIEQALASAKARLTRLHDAIERGIADLDDELFVQRIERAKTERDVAKAAKSRVLARMGPQFDLTSEKIVQFAEAMRSRITEGDVPFRKAYVRATVQDIIVSETEVVIRGRSDTLRKRVNDGNISALLEVPSSVQEWRTQEDSNL